MSKHRTIVITFLSLDGVMQDPSDGAPNGGWAFRHGPEAVAGDKFGLGPILKSGIMIYGRKTWEEFSRIWPNRTDDFSMAMNTIPKLVATRTRTDLGGWKNSSPIEGDLLDEIEKQKAHRDVVVVGSASVVHTLARADRVDEYRIKIFPSIVGAGTRLFEPGAPARHLRLVAVEKSGGAALLRFERAVAPT